MGKKKAILTTLGAVGAIAATGGLGAIGIPGLIGSGAAASGAAGAGMSIGTKLAIGSAAAQAATGLYGARTQARSADRAAELQTQAANRAAEIQDAASQRAEAFARQQAQNAYLNDEAARRGNYDVWAATEGRRGSIGALLGMGPRNIPAYVPGVDPRFDGGGEGTSGPMPVPGAGGPPLERVDQFGRRPGDPMYGTPVPTPRPRRQAPPPASVGSFLASPQAPLEPEPVQAYQAYQMDPAEVEAAVRRKRAGGTPGSVGSYLRAG